MATDQMTLVERLLNPAWIVQVDGGQRRLDELVAVAVMREAAERIRFLEGIAGAVTPGESFQEIRENTKRPS